MLSHLYALHCNFSPFSEIDGLNYLSKCQSPKKLAHLTLGIFRKTTKKGIQNSWFSNYDANGGTEKL